MKKLKGSEKQVKWAESIRQGIWKSIEDWREQILCEKNGFYYFYLGCGRGDRYRVWVNRKLVRSYKEGDFYVEFPLSGVKLLKGNKSNTLIIKPDNNKNMTIDFFSISCGYRGSSEIKLENMPQETILYKYEYYQSPRGNLGVSEGIIFNTPANKLMFTYKKTGRLYGNPDHGIVKWDKENRFEMLEGITLQDMEELL